MIAVRGGGAGGAGYEANMTAALLSQLGTSLKISHSQASGCGWHGNPISFRTLAAFGLFRFSQHAYAILLYSLVPRPFPHTKKKKVVCFFSSPCREGLHGYEASYYIGLWAWLGAIKCTAYSVILTMPCTLPCISISVVLVN